MISGVFCHLENDMQIFSDNIVEICRFFTEIICLTFVLSFTKQLLFSVKT